MVIKIKNDLSDIDDKILFFTKVAHDKLMNIIYPENGFPKKKRRKIDKQLVELLTYL